MLMILYLHILFAFGLLHCMLVISRKHSDQSLGEVDEMRGDEEKHHLDSVL